jgi:hypothetical protein
VKKLEKTAVYYQFRENFNNDEILNDMKKLFNNEEWVIYGIFLDNKLEYEALMDLVTNELNKVDLVYIYSLEVIDDLFYRDLLKQSIKAERKKIIEYVELYNNN